MWNEADSKRKHIAFLFCRDFLNTIIYVLLYVLLNIITIPASFVKVLGANRIGKLFGDYHMSQFTTVYLLQLVQMFAAHLSKQVY